MRIAHVNKLWYPVIGGIETHVKTLTTELSKFDSVERVGVFSFNELGPYRKREVMDNLDVVKVPLYYRRGSIVIGTGMTKELRCWKPTIIHVHVPSGLPEISALHLSDQCKLVVTYHADIIRQTGLLKFYRPLLKRLLDRAEIVLVSNPNMIRFSKNLAGYTHKCRVVPLGIDVGRFARPLDDLRVREYRKMMGSPLVLFVGRFVYYKGIHHLINSIASLSDVRLALVGSGPLEDRLHEQVKNLSVAHRVYFLGSLDDDELVDLYHAADLFVLPSVETTEAYGIVQLEAHASGLPVISTDLPTGVPYVNEAGKTGFVVAPGSEHQLAKAISDLLKNDGLRRKMGDYARERANRLFSKDTMARNTMALYEEVLNRKV